MRWFQWDFFGSYLLLVCMWVLLHIIMKGTVDLFFNVHQQTHFIEYTERVIDICCLWELVTQTLLCSRLKVQLKLLVNFNINSSALCYTWFKTFLSVIFCLYLLSHFMEKLTETWQNSLQDKYQEVFWCGFLFPSMIVFIFKSHKYCFNFNLKIHSMYNDIYCTKSRSILIFN